MIETLANRLYDKLQKEYNAFTIKMKNSNPEYVFNNAYEIAIKEELPDMFFGTGSYDKFELKALLEEKNTLDYLYDKWMDTDGGIHSIIEDYIVCEISDLGTKFEEKMKDKIEGDPKFSLIEMVSDALKDFEHYNFCTHLKEKFNVDDLDIYDIYDIFNSKDGINYLYYFFNELKDNEHLQYLNEIQVIDSTNFNNIEDKIIPQLEILNRLPKLKNQEDNKVKESSLEER